MKLRTTAQTNDCSLDREWAVVMPRVRDCVLIGGATRLAASMVQALTGARLTVLIFHRVLLQPDPLSPSTPDALRFEQAMNLLHQCFSIFPLSDALSRLATGDLPPRAAAITFDDGYADNFTVAVPILSRLGITATFFVATGFIDGGRMWNDTVIESLRIYRDDFLDLSHLGLGTHIVANAAQRVAAIDSILGRLKYIDVRQRDELTAGIAEQVREPLPKGLMMTSAQVKSLTEQGMTIGAHTVNHPILTRIAEREAELEIRRSKEMLDALLDIPVTLFAYPNGKPFQDYDYRHVEIVRRCGFAGAVSTALGAATAEADPFQIPRFTPWASQPWKYCGQLVQNLRRISYPVVA